MTGKRILDAAVLFSATRSVASKHAALRTRQFEAFQKTSSLAQAVKGQIDRVPVTGKAISDLTGRLQGSRGIYSAQASSKGLKSQASPIPSHESVQNAENPPTKKQGHEQDHFYQRSEENSTVEAPPKQDIGIKQETAKRQPLPDGSIPPTQIDLDPSPEGGETHSDIPQSEASKTPFAGSQGGSDRKFAPRSSDRTNIPDPLDENSLPPPEEARRLQRAAEHQIPSRSAEPPPVSSSDLSAATGKNTETAELRVDQEQDVFYTPSSNSSRVLSALPRVKLPKNTVDEQHSTDRLPDSTINQDVFYSSVRADQKQAVPEQQAVPQQEEPSVEMYSELFHSPKVAKILKGRPSPADTSKGLEPENAIGAPVEADASSTKADPGSFHDRPTAGDSTAAREPQAFPADMAQSKSPRKDDIETLAADIAGDTQAGLKDNSSTNSNAADASNQVAYEMHESRVPSSRFGRLWQYGGLATSMAFGAVGESLRRVTGGNQESAGPLMLSAGNMERLVAKLSRMRGAALKLGQMMSFQDSKMLPAPIHEVLQRVQDSADYMPASQRNQVLASNLGSDWREIFSSFEEKPIAAASIGQVHSATIKSSGTRVAVKVQYPGVANSIDSDLNNLALLLTASRLLPKGLYLDKTIANARTELAWECDYIREAECGRRFQQLLQDEQDTFVVPSIIAEASGAQVLTAELMGGIGVTKAKNFSQEQKDWIGTQLLRLCLREITEFKFMQTDPNWTNFLFNSATSKLELLDFGASRDYPDKFIVPYIEILQAASKNDRETIRERSIQLGYLTGHESQAMLNAHVSSVLTLAEPFNDSSPETYDFRDQTITDRVRGLIPLMVRERLVPPPEETYSLHRKLSGAFLLCARLGSRVRCKELFAHAMAKATT
ncbi:MAG: hypothetical protein Q9220_004530 [cf. Caloplaca sp. 1 TL-2023]